MKKFNETLKPDELAKFARHNRAQGQCFPEYSDFFEKRASAAETVLSCFWSCQVATNLINSMNTTDEEWMEPVEENDPEPMMETPWEE